MKHIKLFEDFEYSEDENIKSTSTDSDSDCETCDSDSTIDEFDYENDEFDYEKDGTKYGKSYLDEPPAEIHIEGKKAKPDFLDVDKDGNKKESMKKAAKDSKGKKEEKGLSAAQKKLPAGLRAAIARKASKKTPRD